MTRVRQLVLRFLPYTRFSGFERRKIDLSTPFSAIFPVSVSCLSSLVLDLEYFLTDFHRDTRHATESVNEIKWIKSYRSKGKLNNKWHNIEAVHQPWRQFIGHNRSKNLGMGKKNSHRRWIRTGSQEKERRQTHMQMFRATLKPMRLRQVHRNAHKCRRIFSSFFSFTSSFLFRVSREERSTATRVGGAYPSRKLLPLLFKQG